MVRVFIKGGVWKNSEDEILKAAVMKYGKQQWARVASLLNRKSAKQCKARWNEWLDPSVRKVEWSRSEDEKLLHLAKLMPAQWRTIGPLVGRTAGQCQERYERLLDEAAAAAGVGGEGGEGGSEGGEGEAAGGGSAARRLRPGEIDPHPETKPARPDPVDMDEDEVEMLQEARARLANTQGKKAKRKAREKMLGEAKRLADLQKRRELKAAGLLAGEMKTRSRRGRREIDLGVEIPFHKPAPAGFHETRGEDDRAEAIRNRRLKDVDYKRLTEAQYRSRDREAKEKQRREEARLRSLERSNMQYVVAEVSKRNDPLATRKRGVLSMPEPTIGDDELRRVGKASQEEREALAALAGEGGSGEGKGSGGGGQAATDALLGDYADRPLPTPMRTPAASAQATKMSASEVIQREAMNLRALSAGQTPLLGEENAPLQEGGAGTGAVLEGAAAAAAYGATPVAGKPPDDATAGGRSFKTNATPLTFASSRRDELGLNAPVPAAVRPPSELRPVTDHDTDDAASVGASSFGGSTLASSKHMSLREIAREERRRAKRARRDLEEALASLPAPQFEYELAAPEDAMDEEAEEGEGSKFGMALRVKDRADEDAEELERLKKEAERLYEEQSSALKRPNLPRPSGGVGLARRLEGAATDAAAALIQSEMSALINLDAKSHPVALDKSDPVVAGASGEGKKKDKKEKKKRKRKGGGEVPETTLDYFPPEALEGAKAMLSEELGQVVKEKREALSSTRGVYYEKDEDVMNAAYEEVARASREGVAGMSFSTEEGRSGWDSAGKGDEGAESEVATLKAEYLALQTAVKSLTKACDKAERKRAIRTGGYERRAAELADATLHSFAELRRSRIEEAVYSRLRAHETKGGEARAERLREEVARLEEAEGEKQRRYGELMHEKNRLLLKINGVGRKPSS